VGFLQVCVGDERRFFSWRRGLELLRPTRSCACGNEFGDTDEIVGDHPDGEEGAGLGEAPNLEPGGSADGLGPAEGFLDALAATKAHGIARMPCGAEVNQGLAHAAGLEDAPICGDVRRHGPRLEACGEASVSNSSSAASVMWQPRLRMRSIIRKGGVALGSSHGVSGHRAHPFSRGI